MLDELRGLVEKNKLIEQAKLLFSKNMEQYKIEDEEEFRSYFGSYKEDKLNIWLDSISYKVHNWPEGDYNYIMITFQLNYNNKIVGRYDACFLLNGEFENDYFVMY
ncbi:hypothetical protein QA584_21850 [Anaerocolumna sp. AGMB13025]|uniref:hypothetical protein n=1 Tax=Anaerocolumna sp. AGMB13025 TaxID=3039116 RepID=UPI00241E6C8F|nr:hypothetical protein [Anaerocolumna sp. AGMB13025]WFR56234.1 hypothetical protein QA584_21850 [Anaerocolumna sp. AGMB13025]